MRKILLLLAILLCGVLPAQAQVGLFVRPNSSSLTAPVNGQTWLFNSSNLTMSVFNGANFQIASAPKNNFTAILAPTNYNDNTQGYSQASLWYNTVSGYTYECVDVTTNAAIWIQTNNLGSLTIPLNTIQAGGAATGQSLVFNGAHWAPGTQISSLSVLSQSGAVTGQVPLWNGSSWVAGNPPGGSAAVPLSQLGQSGATTGQVPQWNGSAFVAATLSGATVAFPIQTAAPIANDEVVITSATRTLVLDLSSLVDGDLCHASLPDATTCTGQLVFITVDVQGLGVVFLDTAVGGQTINGADPRYTHALQLAGDSYICVSDGANWQAMGCPTQLGTPMQNFDPTTYAPIEETTDFTAVAGYTYYVAAPVVVTLPTSYNSLGKHITIIYSDGTGNITFAGVQINGGALTPTLAINDSLTLEAGGAGGWWAVSSIKGTTVP